MLCPVGEIKWDFDLGDLNNRRRLANRIKQQEDPISQYLWDQFTPETKELFAQFDGPFGGLIENPLIAAVISHMNSVLEGADLYEPERFAHLNLGYEAKQYIGKTLSLDQQIRFNRLLLEAAYPDEIARSGTI